MLFSSSSHCTPPPEMQPLPPVGVSFPLFMSGWGRPRTPTSCSAPAFHGGHCTATSLFPCRIRFPDTKPAGAGSLPCLGCRRGKPLLPTVSLQPPAEKGRLCSLRSVLSPGLSLSAVWLGLWDTCSGYVCGHCLASQTESNIPPLERRGV